MSFQIRDFPIKEILTWQSAAGSSTPSKFLQTYRPNTHVD